MPNIADELRSIEERALKRLRDLERRLEPLLRERDELLAVLGDRDSGKAVPASPRRRAKRSGRAQTRQGSTGRTSGRSAELLQTVQAKPGITVAEAAAQLNVDPTGLYRIINKLTSDGQLTKRGRELYPGGAQPQS